MWLVESLKICTFMGSFLSRVYKVLYRRVIFHDTEQWFKVEEKLTLGSENDMRNLVKSNVSNSKSENLTCIIFDIKRYTGVMCYNIEEWCKIWGGTDLYFEKWHEEFGEFWRNTRMSGNFHFHWLLLTKVHNVSD